MRKKIFYLLLLSIFYVPQIQAQGDLKLTAPTNLHTTDRTAYSATLKWKKVSGAHHYVVHLKNSKGKIINVFSTEAAYKKLTKKYLSSNSGYSFYTFACDQNNICSQPSKIKNFRTKPAKIKSLELIETGETSATIKINKKPKGKITKYEFEIKTGSTTTKQSFTDKTSQEKPEYEITDLIGSTDYQVRGRAIYNSKNKGSYSPALSVTTSDPIFVGAGDIASCSTDEDEATANLLDSIDGTVFTLGDNVYPDGTASEFSNCYDPSWGRHKSRTKPVAGNHDYNTTNAAGYFGYFGALAGDANKGYYSYNLGKWHIVALNSNCSSIGGCDSDSVQASWLRSDLAANPATCTLAYMHRPQFSSGTHGNSTAVKPLWEILYDTGVDLVLSGHDHTYERFAPQNPDGAADTNWGIREFVVGTGGGDLYSFPSIAANSEIRDNTTWGVLKLVLKSTSYDWNFIPISGATFTDSGSTKCH